MRLLQNPTSDRVPAPGAGVPASSRPAAEAGPECASLKWPHLEP